jgi:hypothetical protein
MFKEERFILAHHLRGFILWVGGSVALGPVARQLNMVGEHSRGNSSPHGNWEAEREEEVRVPISPSKAPSDIPSSH